jgi:hypothetical protein
MAFIITSDTITPTLRKLPRKLKKNASGQINKLLQKGVHIAKQKVSGQVSKDISRGIFYVPSTPTKAGQLVSVASGKISGFPYNFWVNRSITITGRKPYFNNGTQVKYGDRRFRANWRMTPGYFTLTMKELERMIPRTLKNIMRLSLR